MTTHLDVTRLEENCEMACSKAECEIERAMCQIEQELMQQLDTAENSLCSDIGPNRGNEEDVDDVKMG